MSLSSSRRLHERAYKSFPTVLFSSIYFTRNLISKTATDLFDVLLAP
jgi:hypothetical protein